MDSYFFSMWSFLRVLHVYVMCSFLCVLYVYMCVLGLPSGWGGQGARHETMCPPIRFVASRVGFPGWWYRDFGFLGYRVAGGGGERDGVGDKLSEQVRCRVD